MRAQIEGEELLLEGDVILEVNGIVVQEGEGVFDQIEAVTSKLKEGEKFTSKVSSAMQMFLHRGRSLLLRAGASRLQSKFTKT